MGKVIILHNLLNAASALDTSFYSQRHSQHTAPSSELFGLRVGPGKPSFSGYFKYCNPSLASSRGFKWYSIFLPGRECPVRQVSSTCLNGRVQCVEFFFKYPFLMGSTSARCVWRLCCLRMPIWWIEVIHSLYNILCVRTHRNGVLWHHHKRYYEPSCYCCCLYRSIFF